jgi:hypothetical protein
MQLTDVDPRDMSWESDSPVFRVHIQTFDGRPGPGARLVAVREVEVEGADVEEVLEWIRVLPSRQTAVLYLVTPGQDGSRGLVRLSGTDVTQ